MNNIFDTLDEKFFLLFSKENKRENSELLLFIYDYFNQNNLSFIDKEDLVNIVASYIEKRKFNLLLDEDGENISAKDPKEKANAKLRLFKKDGWLIEEPHTNYTIIVLFDDNALIILKALSEIANKESDNKEFTGFIYIIANTLRDFDYSKGISLLERIYDDTNTLVGKLRGLNTSIKKYIQRLMKNDDMDAHRLMEMFLSDYQEKIVDKAFTNLKIRDNPSKYKKGILSKLLELKEEANLNLLINSYIETKRNSDITIEEIKEKIIGMIDYIYDQFDILNTTISQIDSRNSQYVRSATSKLKYITNESKDIDGIINEVFKLIKRTSAEEELFEAFSLYTVNNIDERSIYSPREYKVKLNDIKVEPTKMINQDELNSSIRNLFYDDQFSKRAINNYVKEQLKDNNQLLASKLNISSTSDFVKILLIQLYSNNNEMCYYIESLNKEVKINRYQFDDYLIKRRDD
jgi:hypothetical protein